MSIDSTIGPIKANGNTLSGIFYQIINKFKVSDPITSGIVELSTNGELLGSIENVVLWESDFYSYLTTGVDVYLQMKFPRRYLLPTGYSIRGSSGNCYSTKWKFFGFNEGEETSESKWKLLGENTTTETGLCGTGLYCNSESVATYSIKPASKGFRYLRWSSVASSCDGSRFVTTGMDVYGTLSKTQIRISKNRQKLIRRISSTLTVFILIFTVCA